MAVARHLRNSASVLVETAMLGTKLLKLRSIVDRRQVGQHPAKVAAVVSGNDGNLQPLAPGLDGLFQTLAPGNMGGDGFVDELSA